MDQMDRILLQNLTMKHVQPDANIKAAQKSSRLHGKPFIKTHSYGKYFLKKLTVTYFSKRYC